MEDQETITVNSTAELFAKLKLYMLDESLNDLVIKTIEREVRYRHQLAVHCRIAARREQIKEQTGVQLPSVNLIRQLREGCKLNG